MACKKVRHASRNGAVAAREKMDRKKGKLLQVYQCGECRGWHLGNTTGTRLENLNRLFDRLPASDRAAHLVERR